MYVHCNSIDFYDLLVNNIIYDISIAMASYIMKCQVYCICVMQVQVMFQVLLKYYITPHVGQFIKTAGNVKFRTQ